MKLNDLENKKIAILGLGIENVSLVEFLIRKKIDCKIVICDANSNLNKENFSFNKKENIVWRLGEGYDKDLDDFDFVSRIAGYPLHSKEISEIKDRDKKVISPIKFFFDLCPTKNIIGVTGTNGKGTTSGIICSILESAGVKYYWGGNIGVPVFSFIDKLKNNDWVVLELSSYQLEDLKKSPHIAVITNFSEDHLVPVSDVNPNYHRSMNEYWQAKTNIFSHQKKGDIVILNEKIKNLDIGDGEGKRVFFEKSDLESKLVGEHNKENIAAAVAVCREIGISKEFIEEGVHNFESLKFRIEQVFEIDGISFYNDSFSKTPECTITALKSFSSPVILIAGGADRGVHFDEMAKEIRKRVKALILFDWQGSPKQATEKIEKSLRNVNFDEIKKASNMKEALKLAVSKAFKGDTILLSPGCPSFGMFKDYKERGELFEKEVRLLRK